MNSPTLYLSAHRIRLAGFVFRCAAAVSLATWLSDAVGMDHTVWAAMSALIVTHESFNSTRAQVAGRIAGTAIGALVALGFHFVGYKLGFGEISQIALAVSVCALIASGRPTLRVCLWTCPLVLLTGSEGASAEYTAGMRTLEVLLGAVVGGLMHWLEVAVLHRWQADGPSMGESGGGD